MPTRTPSSSKAKKSRPSPAAKFTVPGVSAKHGQRAAEVLQNRLIALIDLKLTLKHIHWNVVGPAFIGVHLMLDPQVDGVAAMVDKAAERIATLGIAPNGLPGNLVASRHWDDYSLLRATVAEHLGALDLVYSGVIAEHRAALDEMEDLDLVSQDLLVQQTAELEQYHWFVRAHLESSSGRLSTAGAATETAASRASAKSARKAS